MPEAVARIFFVKNVFLKVLPNAQKHIFKGTLAVAVSEM